MCSFPCCGRSINPFWLSLCSAAPSQKERHVHPGIAHTTTFSHAPFRCLIVKPVWYVGPSFEPLMEGLVYNICYFFVRGIITLEEQDNRHAFKLFCFSRVYLWTTHCVFFSSQGNLHGMKQKFYYEIYSCLQSEKVKTWKAAYLHLEYHNDHLMHIRGSNLLVKLSWDLLYERLYVTVMWKEVGEKYSFLSNWELNFIIQCYGSKTGV